MAANREVVGCPRRGYISRSQNEILVFSKGSDFIKGNPAEGELNIGELASAPSEIKWLHDRQRMQLGNPMLLQAPPKGSILEGLATHMLAEQKRELSSDAPSESIAEAA